MFSIVLFVALQAAPRGAVVVAPSSVEGTARTSANVDKFLESRKPAVVICYEKRLAASPKQKGTLGLRFLVLNTGRVSQIEVMNSFDDEVTSCVTNIMNSWVFPPGDEGVRVSVDYKLKPAK